MDLMSHTHFSLYEAIINGIKLAIKGIDEYIQIKISVGRLHVPSLCAWCIMSFTITVLYSFQTQRCCLSCWSSAA
jgi:hypothetical protein